MHIANTNEAYMSLWHEGMTGRGANEVASCLLKIFSNGATARKKLVVWSDNCCGQNKNRMILFLWVHFVIKGVFDEVNHKFLVPGHSFLSCDRDFALIEKRKRVTKCIVPEDVKIMIQEARDVQPFNVSQMNVSDFIDFQKVADVTMNTAKLNISKVQWLRVDKSNPQIVHTRRTLNDIEPWQHISILKKGIKIEDIKNMQLSTLQAKSHLPQEKKKDLSQMIQYLTKEDDKNFYRGIIE